MIFIFKNDFENSSSTASAIAIDFFLMEGEIPTPSSPGI